MRGAPGHPAGHVVWRRAASRPLQSDPSFHLADKKHQLEVASTATGGRHCRVFGRMLCRAQEAAKRRGAQAASWVRHSGFARRRRCVAALVLFLCGCSLRGPRSAGQRHCSREQVLRCMTRRIYCPGARFHGGQAAARTKAPMRARLTRCISKDRAICLHSLDCFAGPPLQGSRSELRGASRFEAHLNRQATGDVSDSPALHPTRTSIDYKPHSVYICRKAVACANIAQCGAMDVGSRAILH